VSDLNAWWKVLYGPIEPFSHLEELSAAVKRRDLLQSEYSTLMSIGGNMEMRRISFDDLPRRQCLVETYNYDDEGDMTSIVGLMIGGCDCCTETHPLTADLLAAHIRHLEAQLAIALDLAAGKLEVK
jgi:hypothetical protein